jgi:hypothetical protein
LFLNVSNSTNDVQSAGSSPLNVFAVIMYTGNFQSTVLQSENMTFMQTSNSLGDCGIKWNMLQFSSDIWQRPSEIWQRPR